MAKDDDDIAWQLKEDAYHSKPLDPPEPKNEKEEKSPRSEL